MTLMANSIPYMGTKRDIAPKVADVICAAQSGIVLDAFSGMCAIGQSVGTRRPVWNNDIQTFPSHVAGALFTSELTAPSQEKVIGAISGFYQENIQELSRRFSRRLNEENEYLAIGNLTTAAAYYKSAEHIGNSQTLSAIREQLSEQPQLFPYCLFTITFSDGYFGFSQSIEIDSIRYAIAQGEINNLLSSDEARWLLIALCHTISKIATTTGHFAQYLNVNENNLRGYLTKRRRSVWQVWLDCFAELKPIGSPKWRKSNKVFNMDSLSLLQRLSMSEQKPSVIYADPPYTNDQYSRYYHVWETLVKYDYPKSLGKGRYREDRFISPFSTKTSVKWAFGELISRTRTLGADLILSYPSEGLLQKTGTDPFELLREKYRKVDLAHRCDHQHSTMGASKGAAKNGVVELVYWARA